MTSSWLLISLVALIVALIVIYLYRHDPDEANRIVDAGEKDVKAGVDWVKGKLHKDQKP